MAPIVMCLRPRTFALLCLVGVASLMLGSRPAIGEASPAQVGLGARLRYIGRDTQTSMAATVNDGFIKELERSVQNYGKVIENDPIPAPPLAAGQATVARVAIPALGVDAPVGRYGVDAYGRIDVPQDATTIGWNPAYTALPGSGGATFFAAHYEFAGRPGVFAKLSTLRAGDEVSVTLSDGSAFRYRVTSTVDYALGAIDMGAILHGREGVESITLMTCSGPITDGNYELRTVVLAERIP
jgi:LPXTG-site transpeptidase (sortase) family protein